MTRSGTVGIGRSIKQRAQLMVMSMLGFAALSCHETSVRADWVIDDIDGDALPELINQGMYSQGREVLLVLSSGVERRLLAIGEAEVLALELCGRTCDVNGDGAGDLIITVRRAMDDGGGTLMARMYAGVSQEYCGQLVGSWDHHGESSPLVFQPPGDASPDGAVNSEDLNTILFGAWLGELDELSQIHSRAADWDGFAEVDDADFSRLVDLIASGSTDDDLFVQERVQQLFAGANTCGLFEFIGRLFGVVDCTWCLDHFADEVEQARWWIANANEELRECRESLERADCPPERALECMTPWERTQLEWARRVRGVASVAAPCIEKCSGFLDPPG